MKKNIPYGKQSLKTEDVRAVASVLKSDWITQGPAVRQFEADLAAYCGAKFAVAVNNGTAALHLANLAAGVGAGDEVIVPVITFAATANSVLYCGANPVFTDIDSERNLDPSQILKKITPRTKVLLPVHFGGLPVNLEKISAIAKDRSLKVIEDACHALGAEYKIAGKWHRVGSCSHSDMCVFSFHPVKSITTGEGGAITTNDPELYRRLVLLRSHGAVRDEALIQNKDIAFSTENGKRISNSWYYEIQNLGYNYRITDFQCALGSSQLKKLNSFVQKRSSIAARYDKAFAKLSGLTLPPRNSGSRSAWHLYAVEFITKDRNAVYRRLQEAGITAQVHYLPLHFHPVYKNLNYKRGDFPAAETYFKNALSLPLFPDMTASQTNKVIRAIQIIFDKEPARNSKRTSAVSS